MRKIREENENVVIYGGGKRCLVLLDKLGQYGIGIKGIAVTDTNKNPQSIQCYDVKNIDEYDKNDAIVISIANREVATTIRNELSEKEYRNIYFANDFCVLEKAF